MSKQLWFTTPKLIIFQVYPPGQAPACRWSTYLPWSGFATLGRIWPAQARLSPEWAIARTVKSCNGTTKMWCIGNFNARFQEKSFFSLDFAYAQSNAGAGEASGRFNPNERRMLIEGVSAGLPASGSREKAISGRAQT